MNDIETNSNNNITEPSFPQETLGEKKHIYGTYIEMAFHNLFINIEQIFAVVFGRNIMSEADANYIPVNENYTWDGDFANYELVWKPMFEAFRNALPEEKQRIEEMMNHHFPMLVPFKEYARDYSSLDIISRVSDVLRTLRNFYSHYNIVLFDTQKLYYINNENFISNSLSICYLGSRRIVKDRFAFDESAMKCTEQYNFSTRRDEKGKLQKTKTEKPGFRYKLYQEDCNDQKHLTAFGLLFFTCLFLEKKYAKVMSDKLKLIAPKDQSVVCEMLSVYRLRMNSQRIKVTKQGDALALDIINELQRCPKDLFEIMHPDEQKKFRIRPKDESSEDVLMVRHSDRFPQLVMKYIDDAHLFDKIRFQVSLGKYFHKFYDKKCIDAAAASRVRALCKSINGFGRIGDIEKMREECWSSMIRQYSDVHKNTAQEQPYITDHHAQYIIAGNRIGMRIMDGDVGAYMPELSVDGTRNLAPSCWMSTYELPAMAFFLHLTDGQYVEEIIECAVANYRQFFSDVETGQLLPVSTKEELEDILRERYDIHCIKDIPKNMSDYLLGKTHDAREKLKRHAEAMLGQLMEQTESKLNRYSRDKKLTGENRKENKIGKKKFVQIKPGMMAAFLAKDIMFFQPNDKANKNKLTGLNFRVLQSVLATYNKDSLDTLKRTLVSAHIIGNNNSNMCNPIVQELWNKNRNKLPENTQEFYEMYLNERLRFLKKCMLKFYKKANPECPYFLHGNKMKWQKHDEDFSRKQAGRYLRDTYGNVEFEKAIELPRGLFDRYIREELKTIDGMGYLAEQLSDDGSYQYNIAYLIAAYFKDIMCDDSQPFYEAERSYRLLNTLYRKRPSDPKKYCTAKEIGDMLKKGSDVRNKIEEIKSNSDDEEIRKLGHLLSSMKNLETDLKRYKVQDMLLFLIAGRIFRSNVCDGVQAEAFDNLRLKDILDEEKTLKQKIRFQIQVESRNGYIKNICKDDLMLKHYANVYKILNDRRLPALLDLIMYRDIEYDSIEKEFDKFDEVHPAILREVFEYEKDYYLQHPNETPKNFSSIVNDSTLHSYQEKKSIKKIRNSFAHNTYPRYTEVPDAGQADLPKKAKAISDRFIEDIKK